MVRTSRWDRFRILWRCFFIQGSWNFFALIGLGFCYSLIPVAKRLYKDPKNRELFLKRHLDFFNSHPYFVSWCLGAVTKLEEESFNKNWDDYRPIQIFKERLIGPLGLIGDTLFWQNIKPAASALGVFFALAFGWIAIPIYLLVYNIPHFIVRIWGFTQSYKKGFDIISDLSMRHFERWKKLAATIGVVATGACIAMATGNASNQGIDVLASFITAFLIAWIMIRKSKPVFYYVLLASLLAVIVAAGVRTVAF
jgi:mannose PTS system EIID component